MNRHRGWFLNIFSRSRRAKMNHVGRWMVHHGRNPVWNIGTDSSEHWCELIRRLIKDISLCPLHGYFGSGTPQSVKIGRFSKIILPPSTPISQNFRILGMYCDFISTKTLKISWNSFFSFFLFLKDARPASWGPPDGWEPPGARSRKVTIAGG